MILLALMFAGTALLYASVGFGGGSTYNALLVLHDADYRVLPAIALVCNLIVVTGGVWRFGAAGLLRLGRIAPFIVSSIPLAWLGGRMPVSETLFVGLLGGSLLLAGVHLFFGPRGETQSAAPAASALSAPLFLSLPLSLPLALALGAGGALGFLAGVVGIGGGVFLAPLLYFMRWGPAREIAAAASFFIFVNSISGLAGQLTQLGEARLLPALAAYWPLFPAVLIGGQVGSRLGALKLPETAIRRLTATLMIYVAVRLLWRWAQLAPGF